MAISQAPDLTAAYAECERIARAHYENFPVASRLLPARMRPHVAAVYAFARAADDFADEGARSPAERQRLLDDWLKRLRIACGRAVGDDIDGQADAAVFVALGDTIERCRIPVSLFEDLISAFRQDTTTFRYPAWPDVLDYCRRSANPVGRIVLRIAGHDDAALDRSSDALCSALQLTNFWQDLAIDWKKGRLYVPAADCAEFGASTDDLDAGRMTDPWRRALARATGRTRALFDAGRAVCDRVGGRLGIELRLTWAGGRRILDRLEADGFDVFHHRPTLRARDVPALVWHAWGLGRTRS
jgi:hydroxysqualene synthase